MTPHISRARAAIVLIALATCLAAAPVAGAASARMQSHIVVLKGDEDSKGVAADHRARHGADVEHVYRHALNGYAAQIPGRELGALRSDRRVAYVEPDGEVRASATQSNATWGLDRIDARSGLDARFTYSTTGSGVTAYIIDTGLRYTHAEFGGRAAFGYDAFGGDGGDCNGHGTHVGGTVGGTTYGVAKAVTLVAVRVLGCDGSGTSSGVIAGIDWVTKHKQRNGGPVVANMSLGGDAGSAIDTALKTSIDAGVTYAVAAGNGDSNGTEQDACNYSPARVPDAITIAATDKNDSKTTWSNYGSCVDWFAPGLSITSAWHQSDTQIETISGTSMATPHVAGTAALYLQSNPTAPPSAVRDALYADATKDIVSNSKSTNNHLLYAPAATATNSVPTASFSFTCTGRGCTFDGSGSSDAEGPIAAYSWSLGDGATATGAKPAHAYGADGTYTVSLTVTDSAGATATTSRTLTVDTTAPDTVIDSGPTGTTSSASASFSFSSEPGTSFQCNLDGAGWSGCSSPTGYTGLPDGAHSFAVRATDAAGNTDQSAATRTFTVDTTTAQPTSSLSPMLADPSPPAIPSLRFDEADSVGPVVVIPSSNRNLRASRRGIVAFRYGPPQEDTTGVLTLRTADKTSFKRRTRTVALGTKAFRAAAGQRVAIKVFIGRRGRQLLRKSRKVRVQATVTVRDRRGNATVATYLFTLKPQAASTAARSGSPRAGTSARARARPAARRRSSP